MWLMKVGWGGRLKRAWGRGWQVICGQRQPTYPEWLMGIEYIAGAGPPTWTQSTQVSINLLPAYLAASANHELVALQ